MIRNKVISMLTFETSDDFEAWQLQFENPAQIINITPIAVHAGGTATNEGDFSANINFVFIVQYWKEVGSK